MTISSRTPEGHPNRCPVCRRRFRLTPSRQSGDAPCPHCGSLVWFPGATARSTPAPPAFLPDFTLDDFRTQLELLKKRGPREDDLASMLHLGDMAPEGEGAFLRIQGMIDAMTREERSNPGIIGRDRRARIAAGSGVAPREIKRFLRQFDRVRGLLRTLATLSIW